MGYRICSPSSWFSSEMTSFVFPPAAYALKGPQVDHGASFGLGDGRLRAPSLNDIRRRCDPLLNCHPFPKTEDALSAELEELIELQNLRSTDKIGGNFNGRIRRPLSDFLKIRPKPSTETPVFGDQHKVGGPPIETGADLARWFENDTPLLGGWMALNALLEKDGKPPTQQAFIWSALDAAISAALLAAWHYKWMDPLSRLKPRPSEVCTDITVLYGYSTDGTPVLNTNGFAGVPRHPAYPSGHSTVAGASIAILKRFFHGSNDHIQLDNLADNAGLARMWAGIHYRADHEFGLELGAAVAELVYPVS